MIKTQRKTQKMARSCHPNDLVNVREDARHGSEQIFHHPLARLFNYTLGVKQHKDVAQAQWFLDALALSINHKLISSSALFLQGDKVDVVLDVHVPNDCDGLEAGIYVKDYQGNPLAYEYIGSTDHPLGQWSFKMARTMCGSRVVTMLWLPQED
jgi:hypothetical protein